MIFILILQLSVKINFLYANDPRSSINWLAEKINDPPVFYTNPSLNFNNINDDIEKLNLPGISKNSIGIFPSIKIGIDSDVWKNSNELEISQLLGKIDISDLYYLNRLLKRILLIEADPPIIVNGKEFSGTFFLRARILKLIQIGALDDAEALLLDADPSTDPKLIDLWSKISFLTFRFDKFCNSVLKSHFLFIDPAHKIICLARSGDWNAAALSLATYSSINEIESDYEKLLINYLDHEAELEITNKDLCSIDKPILVYLCNFSNVGVKNLSSDAKYLYNDLGRSKSIRSRIIASEELVKSGALNPNILFSIYKVKQPSTSGGVWARAKLVQDLENIFKIQLNNSKALENHLKLMIEEFLKNKLLSPFAEFYSETLKLRETKYSLLYELIIVINIMSGNYNDQIYGNKINNSKLQNLIDVIYNRDKNIRNYRLKNNLQHNTTNIFLNTHNTELQRAILEASNGVYPVGMFSSKKMDEAFSKKQNGFILLNAIYLISSSTYTDIADLQIGLASLVKLGLINDFKAISNELLIMEYFKKL
ncbi:MAG: hypothetical protein ACJ0DD_02775 [Paracoccaceae bacterium]